MEMDIEFVSKNDRELTLITTVALLDLSSLELLLYIDMW